MLQCTRTTLFKPGSELSSHVTLAMLRIAPRWHSRVSLRMEAKLYASFPRKFRHSVRPQPCACWGAAEGEPSPELVPQLSDMAAPQHTSPLEPADSNSGKKLDMLLNELEELSHSLQVLAQSSEQCPAPKESASSPHAPTSIEHAPTDSNTHPMASSSSIDSIPASGSRQLLKEVLASLLALTSSTHQSQQAPVTVQRRLMRTSIQLLQQQQHLEFEVGVRLALSNTEYFNG